MSSIIALIPARSGSLRVKNKNTRLLGKLPLIAYTINSCLESGVFERVIVSTDSEETAEIALKYGAEIPFLRPAEYATSISPDIEWLKYTLQNLESAYDAFSIMRPTSPFRTTDMIQRAWNKLQQNPSADSIRAVELCRQHPGKMWVSDGKLIKPFIDQDDMDVAYHARQYQDLPKVYIQNSALEMAWSRVVFETNSREGNIVIPFFTNEMEGFAIDYEDDFARAENILIERSQLNA
jgi:CMP-N,N'-diacetyllegionaminic acid synthase